MLLMQHHSAENPWKSINKMDDNKMLSEVDQFECVASANICKNSLVLYPREGTRDFYSTKSCGEDYHKGHRPPLALWGVLYELFSVSIGVPP